jgi:hypothetical protein
MAVSYSAFLYPAFMSGSWKAIALLLFRRDRKQGRLSCVGLAGRAINQKLHRGLIPRQNYLWVGLSRFLEAAIARAFVQVFFRLQVLAFSEGY